MNKKNFIIFGVLIGLFCLSFLYSNNTEAQTPTPSPAVVVSNINGWAWSSNIGWLSLNCENIPGSCAQSNYKVVINENSGYLTGYAWSPSIGWVKFGSLSSFPTTVPPAQNAKINMATGVVSGWVRACAGTVSGRCTNMTSRTDGWDGWIELSGTNHPSSSGTNKGLFLNTLSGALKGFAWGGPVVGWLNFDAQKGVVAPFDATCNATDIGNGNMQYDANAFGGTGEYEYSWDNGAWSTIDTYTKSISGTGLQSSTLKVREVGKTNEITRTCSGYPNGTTITTQSPGCTINGVANGDTTILVGESANFSITPLPGNVNDYRYTWVTGIGPGQDSNAFTQLYSSAVATTDIRVRVTDKNTPPLSPQTFNCGKLTVKDRSLNLFIGRDANSALSKELIVKKNRNVTLKWENTLDTDIFSLNRYDCYQDAPNVPLSDWNRFINSDANSSGIITNLNTPQTGKYEFKITCIPQGIGETKFSSVMLNVVSTSGSEI